MLEKQLCMYEGQDRRKEKGSVGARPEQEEEESAETKYHEMNTTSTSHSYALPGMGGKRRIRNEVKHKKGGMREKCGIFFLFLTIQFCYN